jgi:catechol 2,3-dioxygenase-like lactoylglutathione lyase family enzyme
MDVVAIDHLNLRIPAGEREQAVDFYGQKLGFDLEGLAAHDAGERPFFAVRLTEHSVIHLWPDPDFETPTDLNYDHVSIHLQASATEIRDRLESADIAVEDDREVLGAAGSARALYVRDPFGYRLELKAHH